MLVLPALPNPREPVTVLLISPLPEDHVSLQHIFDHSNWILRTAPTCSDALGDACKYGTAVAICERDLPDGDWKLVLDRFEGLPSRPNLIVASRVADERLWAEVINHGGYDVLAKPFDPDEVRHVVFRAWDELRARSALAETRHPAQRN